MTVLLMEAIDEVLTVLKNTYGFELGDYCGSRTMWRRIPGHPMLETVQKKLQRQTALMGGVVYSWSKAECKEIVGPFLEEEFRKYFQQLGQDFLQAHPNHGRDPAGASILKQTYPVEIDLETAMQIASTLNRDPAIAQKADPLRLGAADLKQFLAYAQVVAANLADLKNHLAELEAEKERKKPLPLP